jgi:hypothetical protein
VVAQGYVFCLLQPAEITRDGPTRTPPWKRTPSAGNGASASTAANIDALGDSSISREDRLSALQGADEFDLESDEEEEDVSPPSLSPRSLRALQQRVKGTRGVDPNIVGSSGGIW